MNKAAFAALLCALVVAGCGTSVPHQPRWNPNGVPRDENWHSPSAALLRFDANRDGTLARTELLAGLKAEFDTYDTSHKNCLPPEQFGAINQLRLQQDASQATPLADWNQDGCVDFREYSGPPLSLFDSLDVNADGQLTAAELRPGRPNSGQRPPGEVGHGHGRSGPGGGDR